MRRSFVVTCSLLALALAPSSASALQDCVFTPYPGLRTERQIDGSEISLALRATVHARWHEDERGYAAMHTDAGWFYAQLAPDGSLEPTPWLVGSVDPRARGLVPGLVPTRMLGIGTPVAQSKSGASQHHERGGAFASGSGSVDNLVVLLRFSNHGPSGQNRTLPSAANVNTIMNAVGGDPVLAPTGSVRDHYLEDSYGQFTIDSTAVGWLDLPNTETYYANGNSGLSTRIWEAITAGLAAADATIDFSQFDQDGDQVIDAVTFLHSGYGAEWGGTDAYGTNYTNRIWSHKWTMSPAWTSAEGVRVADYNISPGLWGTSGSAPGRIGVVCHELGHFFGLPDLYDTDGSSQGIGNWCLMAAGSWGFDGSQQYPSHMGAWAKLKIGWVTPQLLLPGSTSAPQVELNPTIFRLDSGYPPGEYLLIENRQKVGFDFAIPQGGLAIWHIDENKGSFTANNPNTDEGYSGQSGWPTNGRHYRNALLQADGGFDMERNLDRGDSADVYRSGGVSSLTSATNPNTNAYQGGTILTNGNAITGIGASSSNMAFTFASASSPTNTAGSAPHAAVGSPYSFSFTSSGGTAPTSWSEYRANPSYTLTDLGTGSFTLGGTAQNWNADDSAWALTLPFAFPCWERSYSKVYVSSNGYVDLALTGVEAENNTPLLRASLRIAPLWDDLVTDQAGQNIFVDTTVVGRVRIRWVASPYGTSATSNFAVSLYSDGRIRFEYGSGNTQLTPTVGISRGEGAQFIVAAAHDGSTSLTNASTLEFALVGSLIPPGLSLASNGVLSGTPTTVGTWQPIFRVSDALHRYDQDAKTITVGADCNGNGIPDSQDIANGAPDCNSNGIPDVCEADLDGDGVIDVCDGCPSDPSKSAPGVCGCGVADTDSDGDGTPNCNDACPNDPNKIAPGVCGCGVADTDSDGDGTPNCNDACPNDPNKTSAGVCGCGVADTDSDGDGTPDCNDLCPNDPTKLAPGACGCGIADTDSDGDGTPNCNDGCPNDPNKTSAGACGCGVADTDSDGDGTPNCNDGCPNDPNKTSPGGCGCGVADTDSDGDGTPNCNDLCPSDPNKIAPGVCGCGVADTDSDDDGTPNCNDLCPSDPNKIAPGVCGCGVADSDTDGDGTPNCNDGCPNDPNKTSAGACGCGVADTDTDGDGTPNCNDGCPSDPNKTSAGVCGCGVADTDSDGDGTPNCNDQCPNDPNKTAPGVCGCGTPDVDSDGDGVFDCDGDQCPLDPNKVAPGQCGCGVLDTDSDGDGVADCNDLCPSDPNKLAPGVCGCGTPDLDSDGDLVPDCDDNCPSHANPAQTDCDDDGIGDVCEIAGGEPDLNGNGIPDACEACPSIASYCTSKTNSLGCFPTIQASGFPSAGASSAPFDLFTDQALAGKAGILIYSINGPNGAPFQGGYLCVLPPSKRTPLQTSTATGAPPCTGVFSFDFNARIQSGIDTSLVPGRQVWSQYWSRDAGSPSGASLTNGLAFTICL